MLYSSPEYFFIWYFTIVNIVYAGLLFLGSFIVYNRYKELRSDDLTAILRSNSLPEITFIIPAYNERKEIFSAIHHILNLSYRYKKLIIVNDGSIDSMFPYLQRKLELVLIPKFYKEPLPTAPILGVYQSKRYPDIMVIDKAHRGKFDAVNAGINACSNPFFVINDADTIIDDKGFEALIRPLLTYPETIAVGASVRIKNGCSFDFNQISANPFPQNFLPAMQGLEYLRCFLVRLGWNVIQGSFVISGAFSLFAKDVIVKVGGFCPSVAEDMEIVVRIQRYVRQKRIPHRIVYLPDPIAWTEGPETLKILGKQRIRWHFGLLETIWYHKDLMLNPRFGFYGLFVYPFWLFGEALEPLVEIAGIIYIVVSWYLGSLNVEFFLLFLASSFGFSFLFTLACLFIEDLSFKKYASWRSLTLLILYSFVENFGYRQFTLVWRFRSFFRFFKQFKKVHTDSKHIHKLLKTATE